MWIPQRVLSLYLSTTSLLSLNPPQNTDFFTSLSTTQNILTYPAPTLPAVNATRSFWFDTAGTWPRSDEGSQGELTSDADVCVIGSGVTGVSEVYHLARMLGHRGEERGRQAKVVVLEAREFCSGATGRNGGHMTAHAFSTYKHVSYTYGPSEAKKAIEIEKYTTASIISILEAYNKTREVDLVKGGRVNLLFSEEEEEAARSDYEAARENGIDMQEVVWYTREQTFKRYGANYTSVLIPGNNLWPLKMVSVLYGLAVKQTPDVDIVIHTRTPVTGFSPISGQPPSSNLSIPLRRWSLHTPRGDVKCSYVVHATNAYAPYLLPHLHGPDGIIPTRGQVVSIRASSASVLGTAGFTGNEGYEYWFPRPHGESENELVILGGGREASKSEYTEQYESDDGSVSAEVGKKLRGFMSSVFPGKFEADLKPEMEWTGIMGYTKTHDPFVGPVVLPTNETLEGQYISAGYTGHGMPRGFACAEAVAGMIVADMHGEEWAPPEWFPLHYLTDYSHVA